MRVSLVKDQLSLRLDETLVRVEVSEIDDPPAFKYSHYFKYKVPSGTDKNGKPFGEIIVYSDKNATSGNSFCFELEECRNLKCHKTHCEKCKEKHKNCKKEQAVVCEKEHKKEIENCRKESKGLCPVILGKENRLLVADIFHTKPKWLALQEFGAALFKALFSCYAGQLRQKSKPLHPNDRIYLQLNDNDLDAIPWEYANDSAVLLVHQSIFARVSNITQAPLSKTTQEFPLRIIAVIPDPLILPNEPGENLPDLRLGEQFQNFIDGFTKNGKTVKLERVFPPTVSQVGALLKPQAAMSTVLHFMGHCGHDGNTRALVFEHVETGKLQYINGLRLASELKNVKLAFLSACDSRDVARVLIERGIRFAIGSDCSIPDSLARKFEFEFYKFLANGSTVEMAMYQARAAFQEKDGNHQAYFACAMVLYLSTVGENDSMFKCEEGVPDVQLHVPRNNLMSTMPVFREHRKELADLYSQLRAMVFKGETSRVCTIKGIGGQEFVVEAMRRMAHLFPGGVFAWAFDKEKTSALKFFERLVDVIFSKEVGSRLREQSCNDAEKLGLAIIEQFQTANHATCLLILGDAEILNLGRKEKNIHAEKLGIWLEKVISVRSTVKILLTSQEPLDWLKGELMLLNDLSNPIITRRGDIDLYFEYYASTFGHRQDGNHFYGVPGKNYGFVDRPGVIQNMHNEINMNSASDGSKILALTGLGGIGKTQLMLRYCYLHAAEYDSIFWLTVDSWNAAVHAYCKMAGYLGLDEETINDKDSEQKVINWVISWFGERTKWLLLLDNADGEMSKRIFELLPRKGGNIIFTTRQPISRTRAMVISVDKMQVQEALLLLYGVSSMDLINQKNTDFNYAKEIVTEFDCLPLAIILARAYVERTATSLKGYLSKFKKEHKKLLEYRDETDLDQYEYTVATVWQLSFEQIKTLNSTSAQILKACAFLRPKSIPESLFKKQYAALKLKTPNEQDSDEIIGVAITVLKDFSFMSRIKSDDEEEAASLDIHRLVQKVIYDSMAHEQRLDWASKIVAVLYTETHIDMEAQHKSRKIMDLYLPHIRHLVALINKSDWKPFSSERLYELLCQVSYYLIVNEYSSGNEELLQTEVNIAAKMFGAENEYTLVSQAKLAGYYMNIGEYAKAEALFRQILTIREKTSSESMVLLNNFALLCKRQGNFNEAELLYLRVLAISENSQSPHTAGILNNLGEFYISRGIYDKAEEFHKRALTIREKDLDDVFTAESLNNLAVLYEIRGNYSESERLQERALEIRQKVFGLEHIPTAISMTNLAVIHTFRGKYNEAELLFQKALVTFKNVCGSAHPKTATRLYFLAVLYENQGKFGKAMPIAQEALDIRKEALGPEHPDTAKSLNNLGNIHYGLGKYDEAEKLYNQALAICEKVLGLEHADTATPLVSLASLYKYQKKHDKAESLYNQALAIREKALGLEHPETATALHGLASLYNDQSKYDEAKLLYQRALAIREKALGLEHPDTATALHSLASLYNNQGKYDKAEKLYNQALEICKKALGSEHPDTATALHSLALLYNDQRKYDEGESLCKQALAIRKKVLGSEHPETATALHGLASLYNNQGMYDEAESLYKQALAIRKKVLGSEHPETATALHGLASLYNNQGMYDEAESLYKQALAIRKKVLGSEHPETATAQHGLASLYIGQDKYDEAELFYNQALAIREKALGLKHPATATTLCALNNIADIYFNQKMYDKAEPLYKQVLAIREKTLELKHPDTDTALRALNNIADIYFNQKMYNKAEPLYKQVAERYRRQGSNKDAKRLDNRVARRKFLKKFFCLPG